MFLLDLQNTVQELRPTRDNQRMLRLPSMVLFDVVLPLLYFQLIRKTGYRQELYGVGSSAVRT